MVRPDGEVSGVRRRTFLGAAATVVLSGCAAPPDYPAGPLRIASGGPGGVYYSYAQGIAAVVRAALPRLRPRVIPTAASVANVELVASGGADIGLATADAAAAAFRGQPPFTDELPLLALARTYENYLQLAVRLDRHIGGVSDLVGRHVSIGPQGSGTALVAERILPMAGVPLSALDTARLDPAPAADAVRAGTLDGMFFSGGIPSDALAGLAAAVPVAFLPFGEYVAPMRARYGEVYVERTIPASVYGLGTPTVTVSAANYLVVHPAMDARVAYHLIRALFERRDLLAAAHLEGAHLNRAEAIGTYPLPLHPGAVRYYQEMKR
jgi:TRAP transporter TAXI family solute receptor